MMKIINNKKKTDNLLLNNSSKINVKILTLNHLLNKLHFLNMDFHQFQLLYK